MNEETLDLDRAAWLEGEFMRRLSSRVEEATRFMDPLRGAVVKGRARRDRSYSRDSRKEVGRILDEAGIHDGHLRERLPRGARAVWEVRCGPLFFRRTRMTVVVLVTHRFRALARGGWAEARAPGEAIDLLPADLKGPVVAAVLSTSGWRDAEEWQDAKGPAIYLVEPAPGDGFRVADGPSLVLPPFLAAETETEMRARVGAVVKRERVELLLHGLHSGVLSRRMGVPEKLVREEFARAAREGEFLRLAEEDGASVLRRN